MTQAQKSGKPEDQKKVKLHVKELDMKLIVQCDLPGDYHHRPWNIGQGFDVQEGKP